MSGEPNWELGMNVIQEVNVSCISFHPLNPRSTGSREAMEGLTEDIKGREIKEPLILIRRKKEKDGGFIICPLSGNRRLHAAKAAGLTTVPARCDPRMLSEAEQIQELLDFNEHREDMPIADLAKAYKELMRLRQWTAAELCKRLRISTQRYGYVMKVLDYCEEVQKLINTGALSLTAAYWVSRNATSPTDELRIARLNINGDPKYSTAALEKRAKGKDKENKGGKPLHSGGASKPPQTKKTDRRFWIDSLRSSVIVQSTERTLTDEQLAQALQEACNKLSVTLK